MHKLKNVNHMPLILFKSKQLDYFREYWSQAFSTIQFPDNLPVLCKYLRVLCPQPARKSGGPYGFYRKPVAICQISDIGEYQIPLTTLKPNKRASCLLIWCSLMQSYYGLFSSTQTIVELWSDFVRGCVIMNSWVTLCWPYTYMQPSFRYGCA